MADHRNYKCFTFSHWFGRGGEEGMEGLVSTLHLRTVTTSCMAAGRYSTVSSMDPKRPVGGPSW